MFFKVGLSPDFKGIRLEYIFQGYNLISVLICIYLCLLESLNLEHANDCANTVLQNKASSSSSSSAQTCFSMAMLLCAKHPKVHGLPRL